VLISLIPTVVTMNTSVSQNATPWVLVENDRRFVVTAVPILRISHNTMFENGRRRLLRSISTRVLDSMAARGTRKL